jgi:hypothetical protein
MSEQHECQNCAELWGEEELKEIKDIFQRVAPGEPMPSGECPECGALCHPVGNTVLASCGCEIPKHKLIVHEGITCCPDCYQRIK